MTKIYFDFKTLINLAGKITSDLIVDNKTDKEDLIHFMQVLNGPCFELSEFEVEVIKFLKKLIDDLNLDPKTSEGEWIKKSFSSKDVRYGWLSLNYRRVGRTLTIKFDDQEVIIETESDIDKIVEFDQPLLRQLAIDQLFNYCEYQDRLDLVYKYSKSYLELIKISDKQLIDYEYNNKIYWSEIPDIWSWDEVLDLLDELRCYNTQNDGIRLEIIDGRFLELSNQFGNQHFVIDLGSNGLSTHKNLNLFYDIVAELHKFNFND